MENKEDLAIWDEVQHFYCKRMKVNILLLLVLVFISAVIDLFLFPKDDLWILGGSTVLLIFFMYRLCKCDIEKCDWVRYTTAEDSPGIFQGCMDLRKSFDQVLETYPAMRKTTFARRRRFIK